MLALWAQVGGPVGGDAAGGEEILGPHGHQLHAPGSRVAPTGLAGHEFHRQALEGAQRDIDDVGYARVASEL
eukprot:3607637-Pyramimonas_sp.AAC.1